MSIAKVRYWTTGEINKLITLHSNNTPIAEIAKELNRTVGTINSNIARLRKSGKLPQPKTALEHIGSLERAKKLVAQAEAHGFKTIPIKTDNGYSQTYIWRLRTLIQKAEQKAA
ncbi:TPA: HTH domain-containing protein [Acinetobacter baumannii]|uniref:HTH domain-containing protein n=1 Tax=Acinetobacter baumannii TaxID=470 RepID=UPI0007079CCC|nr:HTH domain-containing protein [Acinetobacter baumannii]KQK69287.1 hypothetical protein AOX60_14895 [Acinetobacter baumannii]MBP4152613.1 HTH domain-containing protein [Acinetobacter baumannii]MBP4175170.1 HTH domain-containing protein [Acinetobacter baumannii]MBP4745776.1 HTH domain-containing protein [Acinetobacter baumannii]MBP4770719.1 HTH domain-containing protein [Acinetobacter baumannii]